MQRFGCGIYSHFELLVAADDDEYNQLNKEKTSIEKGYTHGEVVRSLFHTRCKRCSKNACSNSVKN
jgi:hypothetical protein